MKTKRKQTKTVTLLTQIETLLADALKGFSAIEKSVENTVRELLLSAEASISKARGFIAPAAPVVRHTAKSRPRAKAKRAIKAKRVPAVRAA